MSMVCPSIPPMHSKLSGFFGAMSDGILAVDGDLLVLYGNAVAADILECDVGDLTDGGNALFSVVEDEELVGAVAGVIENGSPATSTVRNGAAAVHISPVPNDRGTPEGALLLLLDTREEQRREIERSRLLRVTRHEMKSPIGAVQSYLYILRDEIATAYPSFKHRGILDRSIARLDALVQLLNDMRDLDQVETSGGLGERSSVDLTEILKTCIESVSRQAEEKNIGVDVQLGAPPTVEADGAGLVRVFDELLQNALRYTPAGGTISVGSGTDEDRVWVRVADTGVGIPAPDLDKIFGKFYRVRNARTREVIGTGLGLSLVKEILRNHSGDIRVESEEDRGSVFTVTLYRKLEGQDGRAQDTDRR